MRIVVLILAAFFIILGSVPVRGQVEGDTLGLTGTVADTVVANRLFEEMKGLMKERKLDEAYIKGEKVISIYLKELGKKSRQLADIQHQMGLISIRNSDFDMASDWWEKSLSIRLNLFGQNHKDVANSYNNLGNCYRNKGEWDKSIQYHNKALEIRLIIFGAEHPDVVFSYNNLGVSYESKGEHDKSIEYHNKASEIIMKTQGAENADIALSYYNIGKSLESKREHDIAIEYFQKSLEIRLKLHGNDHQNVADSYNSLGVSYAAKENYDKAIDYFQKAIEISSKILGAEHPEMAHYYSNISTSYYSVGKYENAIFSNQKALEIMLKTFGPEHPIISRSYNNLGVFYRLNTEYDNALECHQKAILACGYTNKDFSKVNSFEYLLFGLRNFSQICQTKHSQGLTRQLPNECINYALLAISVAEYQNSAFTSESSKSIWLSKNYPIYEQAISVSLLKANVDQNDTLRQNTFSYAEKSKASLLQAQIKAADAINFSGIPDTLLKKEYDLRIDISWREKQRQSLLDKGLSETDTNTLRISSIIFDLKRDYETLKKRFETEYPEYYRLKYDLSTVSLQYVQDTLLQPQNQTLLEYFVGDSSIFLFVVRPDTMIVEEVNRDFPLEDWIQGLRYGLYGYYTAEKLIQTDSLKADARSKYLEFAPKLYEKLVAPVAQYLPEKVILVPDGPLGYVPFDALLTAAPEDPNNFKSYPYLLQKHQFSYTYSATLLREMRDKKHRQEPEKDFIAFAPFYNGDTTLLASMYAYDELMRKDLQPLAYTGPEVAAASKLMRGETIAGAAATEERFTSMASDYRIIHLATHGRADNRVGDYAFLAFTEIKDSIENELLYVKDLYNLSLNADLVVLSACETGIGKLQRGEGIISLARAFAYAGAKSIVTSLWSVNDKSTSELMRFFYRELKRGKDKDEALRLARLRFLKESSVRNSHPFFWAAFVPIGDMRPVK